MILQALVKHYETLADEQKVSRQGWCHAKVAFAINLSADGKITNIIPLKREETNGKKTVWVSQSLEVPEMLTRSSGVAANFLCDNSKYLLGIDSAGSGKRVRECFEAAKKRHLAILDQVPGDMATAIRNFFLSWEPDAAKENQELSDVWEEITAGENLIFSMGIKYAQGDQDIRTAWVKSREISSAETMGICLVTGERAEISRIHNTIKGIQGAQSSGAALVSFNAPSFESYGKEQSYNAPVGTYATFAYTTALNYLLQQKEYVFRLGDTTVVFWAESGEEAYQEAFAWSAEPTVDNQETVKGVFQALKEQRAIDINGMELNKDQKFYILGLAPNAARLSVRFFYQDDFGNILTNLAKHYERMNIVKPSWETMEYMGIWKMLQQTVNQNSRDKMPVPNMAAMVFQAILSGGRYPENLYSNALIRIRAEQGQITWGRAAIIKACLIRNHTLEKGEAFVKLNENKNDASYVLGRLFAVLEAIQEEANPGINATIRDRYFNSACATPGMIFPVLMKLKNSHIKKFGTQKEGLKINYEKLITELMGKMESFPARISLEEQGQFMLGYYHQVQKRYEKKEEK